MNYFRFIEKFLQIVMISFGLASCAIKEKPPAYSYFPDSDNIENTGIIIARVGYYGPKHCEAKDNADFFDHFLASTKNLVNKVNHETIKAFHGTDGKVLYGSQVILNGPDNQKGKYYLGDNFYPSKATNLFGFPSSDKIRIKTGKSSMLQVYEGMAAYSVLTIPSGVYKITGRAYFNDGEYNYKSSAIKSFYIKSNEVVYVGDINVDVDNIEISNNSSEAQQYMNIVYPRIANKLIFRLIK